MKASAALQILQQWPRFNTIRKGWRPNIEGKYLLVDFKRIPYRIEKLIRKINRRGGFNESRVLYLDLSDPTDIWCLQSRVLYRNVRYFLKNFAKVQKWPRDDLPIVFLFRRHAILWNGHHRMFASRLLGRKLRCRVFRIGKA